MPFPVTTSTRAAQFTLARANRQILCQNRRREVGKLSANQSRRENYYGPVAQAVAHRKLHCVLPNHNHASRRHLDQCLSLNLYLALTLWLHKLNQSRSPLPQSMALAMHKMSRTHQLHQLEYLHHHLLLLQQKHPSIRHFVPCTNSLGRHRASSASRKTRSC